MKVIPSNAQLRLFVLVAVLTAGIAAMMVTRSRAQATGPYWFDRFSKCVDPCPGLDFPNCRCFVLPEIVIEVD